MFHPVSPLDIRAKALVLVIAVLRKRTSRIPSFGPVLNSCFYVNKRHSKSLLLFQVMETKTGDNRVNVKMNGIWNIHCVNGILLPKWFFFRWFWFLICRCEWDLFHDQEKRIGFLNGPSPAFVHLNRHTKVLLFFHYIMQQLFNICVSLSAVAVAKISTAPNNCRRRRLAHRHPTMKIVLLQGRTNRSRIDRR